MIQKPYRRVLFIFLEWYCACVSQLAKGGCPGGKLDNGGAEGLHTRKAVGYSHVLAVVLSEKNTDYSPLCSFCLAAVVVCCGEEDERRDGDVAGHERQRLGCCGGHLGDVD